MHPLSLPRLALAVAIALNLLPAQARTNVGLVDYAYVPPDGCLCTRLSAKTAEKYTAIGGDRFVVQKDSAYEVSLKRVKMDDFYADFWNPGQGEFAIVARAFEMSSDPNTPASGFDFRPDAANGGRIIYYSNDVRRQQDLNFGQIPMFGPVVYNGNPVGISLFVLEIDTTNDKAQMATLLSTLAGIGQIVSIPGTPVFNLLENLGTSLINANKDDLLMRYDTTFRSDKGMLPHIRSALFRYGDYVLLRQEDRSKPIPWESYWYAPGSGRLFADSECNIPATGLAYGIIQINRAQAPAYYHTESLGDLLKAMGDTEEANRKPIADAFVATANAVVNTNSYRQFVRLLDSIEHDKQGGNQVSTRDKGNLASYLRETKESIAAHQAGKPAKYSLRQLDQIIARLRKLTGDNSIDFDQFDPKAILSSVQ
jgi:hypothetical protein